MAVDVIAWPGEQAGPLQWKLWRVRSSEPMRSVTLALPGGALRESALRALMSGPQVPEGVAVGWATVSATDEPDGDAATPERMRVFGCQGATDGGLATLRFDVLGRCVDVEIARAGERFSLHVDLSQISDVVRLDLHLESVQTRGGRLLADNPPAGAAGDVVATVESAAGSGVGEVREIAGGHTGLALVLDRPTVIYGRQLTVSGRVVRGGAPSGGEVVFAHGLAGSVTDVPTEPEQIATTDADGRFEVRVHPTSTMLWAAWSHAPLAGDRPQLNTLVAVAPFEVVVRAPTPRIRKARARRRGGKRVRARIVVWNPLAGRERLECRLLVGNRQAIVRRFRRGQARLTFRVTGSRRMKVRAVVGRRRGGPPIAGRTSRVVRL